MMSTSSQSIGASGARNPVAGKRFRTIHWVAALGVVLLIFELYLLINWVTGPYFKTIPYGPSEPPTWMKWGMDIYAVGGNLLMVYLFWQLLFRPWLKERRVTFYGLMCPVLLLTSVYDPLGSYFDNWYNYNAYFLNFGSPLPAGMPGWQSFAEPGAGNTWPIALIPSLYVNAFLFFIWSGCWIMGALRRHFPRMPPALMAGCFLAFVIFDIVIEGYIFMRLGWYVETGLAINQGEYYQNPWRNIILAALMWSMLASLYYFRDDRGQTFVERGLDLSETNTAKGIVLRFFALLAAVQLILTIFYHIPIALHVKYFPAEWPEAISSKTYFTGHICGYDTPRPCP